MYKMSYIHIGRLLLLKNKTLNTQTWWSGIWAERKVYGHKEHSGSWNCFSFLRNALKNVVNDTEEMIFNCDHKSSTCSRQLVSSHCVGREPCRPTDKTCWLLPFVIDLEFFFYSSSSPRTYYVHSSSEQRVLFGINYTVQKYCNARNAVIVL
jgi:hypothetical protein